MKKLILTGILLMSMVLTSCSTAATTTTAETTASTTAATTTAAATEVTTTAAPTTAETTAAAQTDVIRIVALKGPTAMGLSKLATDQAQLSEAEMKYQIQLVASPDEIPPLLAKGEVDLAAVPSNLGAVLFNNMKGEVQSLAINTLGILYVCETGDTIKSMADLKGKTIYSSGKGAVPEYALNYLLKENGIDPETDVTIEFKSEHSEVAAVLASEEGAIAVLPQPFVAVAQSKNPEIKAVLDLTTEWDLLQADSEAPSALVMGILVGRKAYLADHSEQVQAFLADYKQSVDFVNANTAEAAAMVAALDIVAEPIAVKALPQCSIVYIDGAEMQTKLHGFLEVLEAQNPKSIGGVLPSDDFYWIK